MVLEQLQSSLFHATVRFETLVAIVRIEADLSAARNAPDATLGGNARWRLAFPRLNAFQFPVAQGEVLQRLVVVLLLDVPVSHLQLLLTLCVIVCSCSGYLMRSMIDNRTLR